MTTTTRTAFRVEFGTETNEYGLELQVNEARAHGALEGVDSSVRDLRTFTAGRAVATFTVDSDVVPDVEALLDADERVVAYSSNPV